MTDIKLSEGALKLWAKTLKGVYDQIMLLDEIELEQIQELHRMFGKEFINDTIEEARTRRGSAVNEADKRACNKLLFALVQGEK